MGANRFDPNTPEGLALEDARAGLMVHTVLPMELAKSGLGEGVLDLARTALSGLSDALRNPEMQHVASQVDKGQGREV